MNNFRDRPHRGYVLVTGGAGYIGCHACKALRQANYMPVSYDSLVNGHEWAVKWGPLEVGDILDRTRLDKVIAQYNPIAVMHFAACAYVGESVQDPAKYYRNNVAGSLTLLEVMQDNKINKLVFSSSCATYGLPETSLITEHHPQKPINPYGESKLMVERILRDFDAAHSMRSISLRYFNAAGADVDGEIGEAHDPEPHLIPIVLGAALGMRTSVTIFGDDYDTPDGTCIRDYVHVSDLADAHVLALEALLQGAATSAYNLGSGIGFSVREVIDTSAHVTGIPVSAIIASRRSGDPSRLVGDASLIKSKLNWAPRYNNLEDIIETAWRWHKHGKKI